MNRPKSTRRNFIKKSALATFGFTYLPAYLTSARAETNPMRPPSQRINIAAIGLGGISKATLTPIFTGGLAHPVAFCDIDTRAARLKSFTSEYPQAPVYNDFRVLFEEMADDIDAVVVNTQDHLHFTPTLHAMALGKHVYCQKPLTHTFEESEILMRAEKKYGVVTQMGNQGHTSTGTEQFKQLLEAGALDGINRIEAWKSSSLWFMNGAQRFSQYPTGETIPPEIDSWDLWCGPKEIKPYSSRYHPFNWRGFYLYGGGMFGDWGAHLIDYPHDYLELGLPTRIDPVKLYDHNDVLFPRSSHIKMEFPARGPKRPAVTLDWKAGDDFAIPQLPEKYCDRDSDGNVKSNDLGKAGAFLYREAEDFAIKRESHDSVSRIYPREMMLDYRAAMRAKPPENDHYISFVKACMGVGETSSPFSKSGLLTQALILGTIAERLNVPLEFDPQIKQFINNDKANFLLSGPAPRAEWADYYKGV